MTFGYDSAGGSTTCPNSGATYDVGRLTSVTNSVATEYVNYDPLGRPCASQEQVGSYGPYTFGYQYNLAGGLKSEAYPSGRVVGTGFDPQNRPNGVSGTLNSVVTNFVGLMTYASSGAASQIQFGLSTSPFATETVTFDNGQTNLRQQPTGIAVTSKPSFSLGYWYCGSKLAYCSTNTGNVMEHDITAAGNTFAQIFGYDALNRLTSASEGSTNWSRGFGYDQWGNMWVATAGGTPGVPVNPFTPQSSAWINTANNRLMNSGMNVGYDTAGNLTTIGLTGSVTTYGYDAENRMTSTSLAGNSTAYFYDGEGRRVQKVTGTATTSYVYDAAGQLAAEYATQPSPSPCSTCYLVADNLGSTRMMMDGGGLVQSLHDYLPFGEEIPATVGGRSSPLYPLSSLAINDGVTEKFTGKERDVETGLDYFGARYLSSAQGRFSSADDPLGDQWQSDRRAGICTGTSETAP